MSWSRVRALVLSVAALIVLAACAGLPAQVDVPDAATEPGSRLDLGATALVPGIQHIEQQGSEPALVGLTVLEVRAADASVFDAIDNRDELVASGALEGVTPVIVVSQVDVVPDARGHASGPETAGIAGRLASGNTASFVTATQQSKLCGTPAPDLLSPSNVRCAVLLVPDGDAVVAIEWGLLPLGTGQSGADEPTAPFVDDPIVWQVPAPVGAAH